MLSHQSMPKNGHVLMREGRQGDFSSYSLLNPLRMPKVPHESDH